MDKILKFSVFLLVFLKGPFNIGAFPATFLQTTLALAQPQEIWRSFVDF